MFVVNGIGCLFNISLCFVFHTLAIREELPQTGEKDNMLGILGLLSVSLASLFGLGEKKKKED